MATPAEQLASVQAAITAIEGGSQEYTINGVTYKRADLQTLYSREEQLERKINRIAGGGLMRTVAKF